MRKSNKFRHASKPMKDVNFWEDEDGYTYHEDPSKLEPYELLAEKIAQDTNDITILEKHSDDAMKLTKAELIGIIEILTGRLSQARRHGKMQEADR